MSMTAVTVVPGRAGSAGLREVEVPQPGPSGALVRVLEVGIDATDREINQAHYGHAPPGQDYLILGHESLGRVESVGPAVRGLRPGDLVVPTVRRPDGCPNCRAGEEDMCLWGGYTERGIRGAHGFLAEYFAEEVVFLVAVPQALRPVAVLLEPLSIVEKAVWQAYKAQERLAWRPERGLVLGAGPLGLLGVLLLLRRGLEVTLYSLEPPDGEGPALARQAGARYVRSGQADLAREAGEADLILEATGYSPLAFQAVQALRPNGVLCLLSVTGGERTVEIPSDELNNRLVLGNRLVFGSVNANRRYFELGLEDLAGFQERWPDLCRRFFSLRLRGLERFTQALEAEGGIKELVALDEG